MTEYPRVPERGIWTWGYVIYDHRRFLDNMARLRLNLLTIWNDVPPLNCKEIIQDAHARGIRVILGFPWGWGMEYNLADPADRQRIRDEVMGHFREKIAPLAPDGIYFQTLTEHNDTEMNGRSVAALACELVNETAATLFEHSPDLTIHFGLHATSIRDRYQDLQALDPRVTIIWEDGGALPYSYIPLMEEHGHSFAEMLDYSKQLATFRPGTPFGLVPKGWTCLDWANEFEHHQEFLLGVRTRGYIERRQMLRRPHWERVNALWLRNYRAGITFYQELLRASDGRMIVEGLIEDGVLEACIEPSVALYAETLWNPEEAPEEILAHAQSSYYRESI